MDGVDDAALLDHSDLLVDSGCCRGYHVGLGLPDGSGVIVEMTFPDDDTSELVLATHCGTGTYAQDVATVTAWLLPGLAD
ncbi:hypothetical protein [Pseudonocardia sp. Ae707_Ps2]|uniref:hypothetical protein n=1 Tax=Pseudonocardia sp. Ae707_Ps2 TaxID=2212992 RepID=UPI00307ED606